MKCRYCGNDAKFVDNKEIYGRRYGDKSWMAWWCKPCDARVGVHLNDPERPLGKNLANAELRKKKMDVKNLFIEKLLGGSWQYSKRKKGSAYKRLADAMGIDVDECHFGDFELDELDVARNFLISL